MNHLYQLLYFLPDRHMSDACEKICHELMISARKVETDELNRTIAELVGIPIVSRPQTMLVQQKDPLIVLCGLENRKQDAFLAEWKKHDPSYSTLKAVMTPLNSMWSVNTLICELKKERATIQSKQKR